MKEGKFSKLYESTREKTVESFKFLLAKALKTKDLLNPHPSAIDKLGVRDVPLNFLHRHLVDLGSGKGRLYFRIKILFEPKSYTGIDIDSEEVKWGRRRGLNIKELDFVKDTELKGDLAVMIGTHTTPEIVYHLGQRFNLVFFEDSANTQEEVRKLTEEYKKALGDENLKIILKKELMGLQIRLFGFYSPIQQ